MRTSIAALAVICAGTSGCVSLSYTDSQNRRHIIGFVDIKLEPAAAPGAASAIGVTQMGIAVYSSNDTGTGLVLGYQRQTLISLPPASCVDIARPGPCAAGESASPIAHAENAERSLK